MIKKRDEQLRTFGSWFVWACGTGRPSSNGACDASNTAPRTVTANIAVFLRVEMLGFMMIL